MRRLRVTASSAGHSGGFGTRPGGTRTPVRGARCKPGRIAGRSADRSRKMPQVERREASAFATRAAPHKRSYWCALRRSAPLTFGAGDERSDAARAPRQTGGGALAKPTYSGAAEGGSPESIITGSALGTRPCHNETIVVIRLSRFALGRNDRIEHCLLHAPTASPSTAPIRWRTRVRASFCLTA